MSEFKGKYIEDFRRVIIAAAVAGESAMLIGLKGMGKTAYPKSALANIVGGSDKVLVMKFTSVSQPPILEGRLDLEKMYNEKKWAMDMMETIHNPNYRAAIWDEFMRSGDPILDLGLQNIPTARDEKDAGTINIFTANFSVTGERNEPVIDRITMWYWVEALSSDEMDEVLDSQLESVGSKPVAGSVFPTLEEIQNVRSKSLTPRATRAVRKYIRDLRITAERGLSVGETVKNFPVNIRLQDSWARIFTRMSIFYSGTNDFETIPYEARILAKYAYQNTTKEDFLDWVKLITPIMLDPIDAACQDAKRDAFKAFKQAKSIQDIRQRGEQLGSALQLAYSNLDALGSDPRIDQTKNEIQESFMNYLTGKDVYESGTEG